MPDLVPNVLGAIGGGNFGPPAAPNWHPQNPYQPADLQKAISKVVPGQTDAHGNIWSYQRVQVKPGGPMSPFKPKTVTYLVNQHGQHFQQWFQNNFGIDKAGQTVNPFQLAHNNPMYGQAAVSQTPLHHAPATHAAMGVAPHGSAGPPPPAANPLGNIKVDPKVAAAVQAAMNGTSADALGRGINVPQIPQVNPAQFAQKATQIQFGPLIQALQQQQDATQGSLNPMLQNLDKWYGAVGQQANQSATSNAAAYQQAGAANTNDAQKIISSLTGGDSGAGYALAQQAMNGSQALAGQGANQAGIDNALKTDVVNNLAGQKSAAQIQVNNALQAIRTQQLKTQGDMGGQAAQNYLAGIQQRSGAITQNLQNQSVAQNMKLAAALAGPQIAGAKLANVATSSNILNNNQSTALNTAVTRQKAAESAVASQDAHQGALLTQYLATHPQASSQSLSKNYGDPGFQNALRSSVESGGMIDATGHLVPNPERAFQIIMDQLQTAYPNDPANVRRQIAQQFVAKAMTSSRYANKWAQGPNGFHKR